MRTITLEVPEELAEELEALPIEERNNFAVAALWHGLSYRDDETEETDEEKAEILAALLESKAQHDAGELLTLDDLDAAIEQQTAAFLAAQGKGNTTAGPTTGPTGVLHG